MSIIQRRLNLKNQSTTKIFENITQNIVSEETAEEIEQNFKDYFEILLLWIEVKKDDIRMN